MALSHQFIWSSTSLMLCFIFSGGRSLDWPTMAGRHIKRFTFNLAFMNAPKWRISQHHCNWIFTVGKNFMKSTITHGPQRCSMQKHPFLCSGSGIQAGWVAALPFPSWRVQDQRAELLPLEWPLASLHHPWLSLAWWASPALGLHWHVHSVMSWPWKRTTQQHKSY